MKQISLLILVLFIASFTSTKKADSIAVLYDGKPIDYKKGIKPLAGKFLTVVNNSGGKIYKVELLVSTGKRPCYSRTFLNEEAQKPIPVDLFMSSACAAKSAILLTVNIRTSIVIPIIK